MQVNKRNQLDTYELWIGKRKKTFLFIDDIIMNLERPKEFMVKPNQNKSFSKVAGYKRIYKDREDSIYNSNKKVKYLRINLAWSI